MPATSEHPAVAQFAAASVGRLHILTDFRFQQRYSHADLCEMAIRGGADVIQYRQKHGAVRHRLAEAHRVADVCRAHGVPLIINDSVEIALAVGAAGVHLGQGDFPVDEARLLLPPDSVIGATANTLRQAQAAWQAGATYVGYGPVYDTRSKDNPSTITGLAGVRAVSKAVPIPIIAIAGISAERVADVLHAGAHGVAVMTAVSTASDPVAATAALRAAIAIAVESKSL